MLDADYKDIGHGMCRKGFEINPAVQTSVYMFLSLTNHDQ